MRNTMFVPMTLAGLLLVSPMAVAVEAHHPDEEGAVTAGESAEGVVAVETVETLDTVGTTDEAPSAEQPAATGGAAPAGGMMMGRGMGQGGGMMAKQGRGVTQMHNQVMGRLDLLEARLAKVETMLERLLQR